MRLLQENNYALARFENEEFELADITTALAELDALRCFGTILDFGDMPDDLSRTESFLVALNLQEHEHLRCHKVGLIGNGSGSGIGQIAEYARGRGLSVQTFSKLDRAVAWLQNQADSVTT